MRISTKGQYALEAMLAIALAPAGQKTSIRQIGEATGLSENYLEQIIAMLKKAGLVISVRGNKGGYQLAARADRITAGDVLRAAEGPLAPVRCTDNKGKSCAYQELCLTRKVWRTLDQTISLQVDRLSLAKLAAAYRNKGYAETASFDI